MLADLAKALRAARGVAQKRDIAGAMARLGVSARLGGEDVRLGDDCAAIPDGEGWLLFAVEGFMNEFVAADPWFAGWCGVMVNISDIAAMGGRPIAVVDAMWSSDEAAAAPILDGLAAAASAFGCPVVGGHTNVRASHGQLAVAILGRASRLLTSFDARPGDRLVAAIDLRGRYREPWSNWDAATTAPAGRLGGDVAILPAIAEAGLSCAGKDISQAGLVGTAMMLAEASGVGLLIDVAAVPRPEGAPLARWLQTFPSFGYILAVRPENVAAVVARFEGRGIAAADIGAVVAGARVEIAAGAERAVVWDFAAEALTGCGARVWEPA